MRIYLAGSIDLLGTEAARQWREFVQRLVDQDFPSLTVINPMDYEPDEGPFRDEQIVNTDKFLLRDCDALLVDGRQPGWGTAQEVLLAHQQAKLVVVWGIERDDASIWLRHHVSHFEPALVQAVEYLYQIAGQVLA